MIQTLLTAEVRRDTRRREEPFSVPLKFIQQRGIVDAEITPPPPTDDPDLSKVLSFNNNQQQQPKKSMGGVGEVISPKTGWSSLKISQRLDSIYVTYYF